jgi:hypothetical protein
MSTTINVSPFIFHISEEHGLTFDFISLKFVTYKLKVSKSHCFIPDLKSIFDIRCVVCLHTIFIKIYLVLGFLGAICGPVSRCWFKITVHGPTARCFLHLTDVQFR